MPKYRTWVDPRAEVTRRQLRSLEIRDFKEKCARWALHLSEEEYRYLEQMNPETLGALADPALYKAEWARFIDHPDSKPFRVST